MTFPEPLPFQPESDESIKARFPAAIAKLWDFSNGKLPWPPMSVLREHVFDFKNGMRMIVSKEGNEVPFQTCVHFSFGIFGKPVPRSDAYRADCDKIPPQFGFSQTPVHRLLSMTAYQLWFSVEA